ncbi:Hpt domain-containing protein [Flammeovirga aprica]|uniref:Hpt domain-containing protein n=1 Tax=Flammeovirga aprica JL-4 TaxID=694437 RepID=A0A7X9XC86_9BACT|nr:Hpt domain-containing protein [Flammeovirga aprica]NME71473.1 Hpt domain-containing protein [Flammeovirga aprica JL-4]
MGNSRVDLSYLETFSGGDKILIAEMMERFIVDAPDQLKSIEESIGLEDWKSAYKNLHNFKSTLNFIAIQEIKDQVLVMEKIAKEETSVSTLKEKYKILFDECKLLVEEIKETLSQ